MSDAEPACIFCGVLESYTRLLVGEPDRCACDECVEMMMNVVCRDRIDYDSPAYRQGLEDGRTGAYRGGWPSYQEGYCQGAAEVSERDFEP